MSILPRKICSSSSKDISICSLFVSSRVIHSRNFFLFRFFHCFLQSYQHFLPNLSTVFRCFFWITGVFFKKNQKSFQHFSWRNLSTDLSTNVLFGSSTKKGSCSRSKFKLLGFLGFLLQSVGQIDFDLFRFKLIRYFFFLNRRLSRGTWNQVFLGQCFFE